MMTLKGAFYGPSKRWYKDLPESARELVDDYLIAKKKYCSNDGDTEERF